MSEQNYKEWEDRYDKIQQSLEIDLENKLLGLVEEIERDFTYLGVTQINFNIFSIKNKLKLF